MKTPDSSFMKRFQEKANRDPELQAIGKYFNCDFLLDMEEYKYLVKVREGKITNINPDPLERSMYNYDSWDFAFRGPLKSWQLYLEPVPPPLYHHLFAIVDPKSPSNMRVEGNWKKVWQHVRAFTAMMELMRKVT